MSPQHTDDFNPWVCQPETVQLDLEWHGRPFYILIKKRLNTGEDRAVRSSAIHGLRGFAKPGQDVKEVDPELLLNMKLAGYTRLETYIIEWSLTTDKGVKLSIPSKDRGQLEALESTLTDIMENAITKFIEERDEAEKPLKKVGSSSTVKKLSA